MSANQVSLLSVVFALIGTLFFVLEACGAASAWGLLVTAACIQLRLLANMLDGLIAVEGGGQTKIGELFNEFPDRLADVALLAGTGYAAHWGGLGAALGWSAAVLAVTTAYIRAVGARRGHPQDYRGPQAKQQRMWLLTVACILGAVEKLFDLRPQALFAVLILINLGTLLTCVRRTARLAQLLEEAT
jgi:phosphatidylglycerophosphate synthase